MRATSYQGLSPHVRGSRDQLPDQSARNGSIPARAGEPFARRKARSERRVYPRTCGGALSDFTISGLSTGLSPHVRGSPRREGRRGRDQGSIPARAGEPTSRRSIHLVLRVYPRTCGGASVCAAPPGLPLGLSPHVRGSLWRYRQPRLIGGSIPARAGEPALHVFSLSMRRVYPRTCGGAASLDLSCALMAGLSPHVRGSLVQEMISGAISGSIPARAGEPLARP